MAEDATANGTKPSHEDNTRSNTKDSSDAVSLKIYSPFKVYFDGEAKSVSAESSTGPFDILPKHHNFITLLQPCDVRVVLPNDEAEAFAIQGGVMHVHANKVVIFLDV
jgi:F0F1-type ATP synthase epsilon subunit